MEIRYHRCQVESMEWTDPERMRQDHEPEDWDVGMSIVKDHGFEQPQSFHPVRICSKCHCLYVEY